MIDVVNVSVVAPMHNEAENVEEFFTRVHETLKRMGVRYEVVIVDDGSSDGTGKLLHELAQREPSLKAIILTRNFGQCPAIYAGLQETVGEWVIVMDSDLQHAPEEIPDLLSRAIDTNCDLVSGRREGRKEGRFSRKIPSRIANWAIRKATGCPARDMGGFKCIRGQLARSLRLFPGQHRFLPALIYLQGGSVEEVPISAPPRVRGKSHYHLGRTLNVLFDIISLRFQAAHQTRPLQFLGRIALFLFGAGGIVLAYMLFEKFVYDIDMGTRPLLPLSVLSILLGGISLLLGFIAEMVTTILYEVHDAKPYRIAEIVKGKTEKKTETEVRTREKA